MALLPAAFAQPATKVTCDRACLENYIDRYLDAMLAHKVSPELFAKNARFTENGVELPLGGEGLWYSMSGKGTYKFYVPDIETQQVAFIGTVKEGGTARSAKSAPGAKPATPTTVAVAIRLKIVNGLITEAEQLAIRPEQSLTAGAPPLLPNSPRRAKPLKRWARRTRSLPEVIPEAKRHSREELVRIGNYYFAGLQRNDGKGYYPFTDDAVRFENGMVACGLDREGKLTPESVQEAVRDRDSRAS